MSDRAIVFIDGNNWYHSLKLARVPAPGRLDYARISRKLLRSRQWVGTRYYIGQVQQQGDRQLYADQQRFLASLGCQDDRITTHLGRLERRTSRSPAAQELLEYLARLPVRIDRGVFQALVRIGNRHRSSEVIVEKAVDVMLAVDVVVMAERNAYDTAYLLSADGDFTPELAAAVDAYIRLDADWMRDCYR